MEALQAEVLNFVALFISILIAYVGRKATVYLNEKGIIAKMENKKELVHIVVTAVEQTYKHLGGEEKLNVAKIELIKLMNEKKIKISEQEVDMLIEHTVKEMNDAFKRELNK